jgi:hypothetical protein
MNYINVMIRTMCHNIINPTIIRRHIVLFVYTNFQLQIDLVQINGIIKEPIENP